MKKSIVWVIPIVLMLSFALVLRVVKVQKLKPQIDNTINRSPTLTPFIEVTDKTTHSVTKETLQGKTIYVSPSGNDMATGSTKNDPVRSIQKAVNMANSGDTVYLLSGIYYQDFRSIKDGKENAPITITGTTQAIIKGAGAARIVEINHDFITINGFTVDGLHGDEASESGYRDKLIYVQGKDKYGGVNGLRILYMKLQNAGGECVRLRYFAQNNEIAYNKIINCGVYDYRFFDGGKNGEGIYIGTAPEQRDDGENPTSDIDESNNNWIHHNTFDTQGNECVDIKEDSKHNVVEHNMCTGQKDSESGGMDSRGGYNIFRYNKIYKNVGAGVRLGGDTVDQNINNDVYENVIKDNQNGGIKIMTIPQGKICGNIMSNNIKGEGVGKYGSDFKPSQPCSSR